MGRGGEAALPIPASELSHEAHDFKESAPGVLRPTDSPCPGLWKPLSTGLAVGVTAER